MLQSLLETTLIETARQETAGPKASELVIGQIVKVSAKGRAVVDFPGCLPGGAEASSILPADPSVDAAKLVGASVLLWMDNASGTPVILGLVRDTLLPKTTAKPATKKSLEAHVDGERIVLEGKQQIELRCGESSITLRKDGKILIKGTDLVSRATKSNRIKGANVAIN